MSGSLGPPRKCANCHEREGTITWGDALAMTHGFTQKWCETCALEAQLAHAKERASMIPHLESQLAESRRENR